MEGQRSSKPLLYGFESYRGGHHFTESNIIKEQSHYPLADYNPLRDIWEALPEEPFELSEGFLEYFAECFNKYGVMCETYRDAVNILELLDELGMLKVAHQKDGTIEVSRL